MFPRSALIVALWVAAWGVGPAPGSAEPSEPVTTRAVRPPDEPGRRGLVAVPAWVVWAATTATVAIAAGTLLRAARRSRSR